MEIKVNSFTPEQATFLREYATDLKKAFSDYVNALDKKFAESSDVNFKSFKIEAENLKVYSDKLSENFDSYTNRVVAEVRSIDKANADNHAAMLKEMRISSIATIFASGRGLETSCSTIHQIEELITNQVK